MFPITGAGCGRPMKAARRLAVALGCVLASVAALAQPLTEQEEAGRALYLRGASASGARISARVGIGSAVELSGDAIACGNCHGEDGRGRAEGGIQPPNIQWSELTKPYGHRHDSGRNHGPFDEDALRRLLQQGTDPDGNRLDGAMPRYTMSAKDFASLVAYLKRLETQLDPGLGADTLRVGTLLPTSGRLAPLGEALKALLTGYFDSLNARGGIHGRKLELLVQPLPEDPAQAAAAARELLAAGRVFAVLAPLSAGVEQALSEAASTAQLPVVGPLTLFPEDPRASNPYVFHLLPGVPELARVLARYASQDLGLGARPIVLWHADTDSGRAHARDMEGALREAGWPLPILQPFLARGASHDALAASLKERGVASVLVLGAGADLPALAAAGARVGWVPQILVPGPLAARDIVTLPAPFKDKVMLAYPTSPSDQRDAVLAEIAQWSARAGANARGHQAMLVAAHSAALLFVEGLKRTGRDLSRRKLLATLEGVQSFDTGLLPRLSYNGDRRIGALGGYLVAVDLEGRGLRPVPGYRSP